MAVPSDYYGEITATTLAHRRKQIADNVSNNNAIFRRMGKKGNIKTVGGGDRITQPLDYAENSTYQRYSGYEPLDISISNVITAAYYPWRQVSVAVSMSGLEMLQNSGKEAVLNLLEARIKNAERTMANNLSADAYSDGTASSGKQIGGLQHLVADTPSTGTVGGIDRSTYSFWRNYSFDATTDGGAAATAANITSYMNRVWVEVARDADQPDLILADSNYWRLYLESRQAIQRVTSVDGDPAESTLRYMTADVVLDGGVGGQCPANHMYFLNTNYIHLVSHRDCNFTVTGKRESTNQDAMVKFILFAGNMTLSNASLQGVLKD